jgi:nicotinamidase-related amidase
MVVRGLDIDGESDDAFYVSFPHSPSRLRSLLPSYTTIYMCGASPDGCIEATARTASLLGYHPVILGHSCSSLYQPSEFVVTNEPIFDG